MELDDKQNLFVSDFIGHRILKFPQVAGKIQFPKGSGEQGLVRDEDLNSFVALASKQFYQPNDFVILRDGSFLIADANFRYRRLENGKWERRGILWFASADGRILKKLVTKDFVFVGIGYDRKNALLYAASAPHDYFFVYQFDLVRVELKELNMRDYRSKWTLDGISVDQKSGLVYLTRINKGQVNVLNRDLSNEIAFGDKGIYCLLEDTKLCHKKRVKPLYPALKVSDVIFDPLHQQLVMTSFRVKSSLDPLGKNPHLIILPLK
jgi:sugar lactone lactonase YvrE